MPISIKWHCDGRVIYSRVAGTMNAQDLADYSAALEQMMARSDVPLIHIITDLSDITGYPRLGDSMRAVKMPSRVGWSLVIGMSDRRMVKFLAQVIVSALRLRFRAVNTLDEALDFLQRMDTTLPDLRALQPGGVVAETAG